MNTMMRKMVGTLLVITALTGTASFADGTPEQGEMQEMQIIQVMDTATARELLGELPEEVSEKHREQIERILDRIDYYSEEGDYERVAELWNMIDEIIASYGIGDEPDPENCVDPDAMPVEMLIEAYENEIARLEEIGDFEAADQLRAELEGLLGGQPGSEGEFTDPDVNPNEAIIEEYMNEIRRLEDAHDFEAADRLRGELEAIMNGQFGEGAPAEPEGAPVEDIIKGYVNEIRRLEDMQDFEAAQHLRSELEGLLFEHFGDQAPCEPPYAFEDPDAFNDELWHHKAPMEEGFGHDLSGEKIQRIRELIEELNFLLNDNEAF